MPLAWLWTEEADAQMARLEDDDSASGAMLLARVHLILGRLERDPGDQSLATRAFTTPHYGHVRATPIGIGEWCLLWAVRSDALLVAIHLDELPV